MTRKEYRRAKAIETRNNKRVGVKILKIRRNHYTGITVQLTRMTAKSGKIIYAVLVKRKLNGKYYRIYKYDNGIGAAWNCYQKCIAA